MTPLDGKDNSSNYNITSDIIFNGAYPPNGDPFTHLWHGYVSEAVSVTGNSFAPTTVGASGIMLAAVNGAVFSANIVLGHAAEQPGQDMALISSGMDPSSFFAQDVTLHRNVGWQHSSGPLSLLKPQLPPNPLNQSLDSAWMGDSGMHPHSFSVDSVEQRNLIGRKGCCRWASAHDLPPAPILTPRGEFDGRPVLTWSRPANLSSGEGATASIAWSAERLGQAGLGNCSTLQCVCRCLGTSPRATSHSVCGLTPAQDIGCARVPHHQHSLRSTTCLGA